MNQIQNRDIPLGLGVRILDSWSHVHLDFLVLEVFFEPRRFRMEDLSDNLGGNKLWAWWQSALGVSRFGLRNLQIVLFWGTFEFWVFVVVGI